MNTHAQLSPSSRYRWAACPGSVKACAAYPEGGKSSPSAIEGTHTHTVLEHCIKNGVFPEKMVGLILHDHEGSFAVTREQAARVGFAYDYILKRSVELSGPVLSETRVDPEPVVGVPNLFGTVDVQIRGVAELELIDYKDGVNPVEAEGNLQLEQYFFGVLADLLKSGNVPTYTKVTFTIIQPRLADFNKPVINSHTYAFSDLIARIPVIREEVARTEAPDAPRVPGEKQCRYCPHKVNCDEFTKDMFNRSGVKFEAIQQSVEQADAKTLDNERIRSMIEVAPILRRYIEEVEEEAVRRIMAGSPIPGLKVVRGRGTRGWAFGDEEMETKLRALGIPKKSVYKTSIISPAQLEKLRWSKRDGSEVQLSKKKLEVVESTLIKTSEGRLTVVPEADRRAAVEVGDLKEMFKPVEPAAPAAPAAPAVPSPVEQSLPDWLK